MYNKLRIILTPKRKNIINKYKLEVKYWKVISIESFNKINTNNTVLLPTVYKFANDQVNFN